MVDSYKIIESKKFMWDGKTYESQEDAQGVKESYESEGFDTEIIEEEDQYLLYTRRVVTEIVVEGQP